MKGFALSRQPVPMKTAESINSMIRERHLKAGDQLPSQRELSNDLGVSRPSLREALSMPETLGVVSVQPGRGVVVAKERSRAPTGGRWRFGDRYALKEEALAKLASSGPHFLGQRGAIRIVLGPEGRRASRFSSFTIYEGYVSVISIYDRGK